MSTETEQMALGILNNLKNREPLTIQTGSNPSLCITEGDKSFSTEISAKKKRPGTAFQVNKNSPGGILNKKILSAKKSLLFNKNGISPCKTNTNPHSNPSNPRNNYKVTPPEEKPIMKIK